MCIRDRYLYQANRASGTVDFGGKPVFAGGENNIAVYSINQDTGEPALIQNIDTRGFTPRTFAVDPSGRMLAVGNQTSMAVREGETVKTVPTNLAVFRIRADGMLDFVQRYDVAAGRKPLWWMGLVPLR